MCCNLAIFISLFDYYVCTSANSAWTGMNKKKEARSGRASKDRWMTCLHCAPTGNDFFY